MLLATRVVFVRAMRLSLRNPTWIVIGLTQPILYLALFGPLLRKMNQLPGFPPGSWWQVFVPGLLIQLGIFGALFVGFGLVAEYRAGVIEQMRVTPAPRMALLLGRVLRDVIVLVVQALVLTVAAVVFGMRAPIVGVVVAFVLVALLGAACASVSYAVALITKSEDVLAPLLNTVAVPVLLLSGILLPMSLAPGWLRTLSEINPFSHVVDGIRSLFRGDFGSADTMWGLIVGAIIVALGLIFGARTFQRESA
ncbi:MAG: ABC transporter permease [Mycobacteriales bacterium]|nr:MAG: multidrug ABC transporter permease [Pseudonocardiales bacterium]